MTPGACNSEATVDLVVGPSRRAELSILRQYPQMRQMAELFNHLKDVMAWIKDRHGRFCWVNRTVLMMEPRNSIEAILGKTDHDFAPAFLADQYRRDDEQVLAGIRIVNRIEPFRGPDGTTGWHLTNKIPLFDDHGMVIGSAGIAQWMETPGEGPIPGGEFADVLAYMRDHYALPISNQQLSRISRISVRTFERRFRGAFGVTPQRYLRNLRMRLASHALVYTAQSLAQVATGCGFADQSHFTHEFRRHFGQTPREYRDRFAHPGADASKTNNAAAVQ